MKQYINGVNYDIVNDSELKPNIHPCTACAVEKECTKGMEGCIAGKFHYVLKKNPILYKDNTCP
jgi:hypothetical protein